MLNTTYHTIEQINKALDVIKENVNPSLFQTCADIECFCSMLIFSKFNVEMTYIMFKQLRSDGFLSLNDFLGTRSLYGDLCGWTIAGR